MSSLSPNPSIHNWLICCLILKHYHNDFTDLQILYFKPATVELQCNAFLFLYIIFISTFFFSVHIQLIQYCTFFQPLTSGPFFSIHISNVNQSLTTIIKKQFCKSLNYLQTVFYLQISFYQNRRIQKIQKSHNYFTFLSKPFWIPNNF